MSTADSGNSEAARLAALLGEARLLLGVEDVQLSCEWELETVRVSLEHGELLASDGGATYAYLSRGADDTYVEWDWSVAAAIAGACGATLVDSSEDGYSRIVIGCRPVAGMSPSAAVASVGAAIDAIFAAHVRPDLRAEDGA